MTSPFRIGIFALLLLSMVLLQESSLLAQTNFVSHLPLVKINTEGKAILDEPKIMARMEIIDNGSGENRYTDAATEYDGWIGIELRGSTSQGYPQKPYGFETRNADGSNLNVSILGMPEENDWVLLSNYNDKSFMRNILGFKMFEALGNYAPRMRLVEVFLNGSYQGIYLLGEKIKRDKNRVDIANLKEEDIEGEELTGGYIFKIDYWAANNSWKSPYSPLNHPDFDVHFVFHDPSWDELMYQQKNYLEDYVTGYESVLYSSGYDDQLTGYESYIDVESFIDYFIVNEISRNNDGFKKSRYFHKDKNGKIAAGPVWDFDWAWKNINQCYIFKATDGSGWAYKINDCNPWVKSPGWMVRLFYDQNFRNRTNCRYTEAREGPLSDDRIFETIDSLYNVAKDAQARHFDKWKTLGVNVGAPEVGSQPTSYLGEVDKLRDWITTRLRWLDANMIGTCTSTPVTEFALQNGVSVYPNPATTNIIVRSDKDLAEVSLTDMRGTCVYSEIAAGKNQLRINLSGLASGVYILRTLNTEGSIANKKVVIR